MRVLFLVLVIANIAYFGWQTYNQPSVASETRTPLPIDDHTPPLVLLNELPNPPSPLSATPPAQRESALQELPTSDESTSSPAP